ncbi:MAG TPA: BMC domain-containing protein [Candidatus Eisenbergiella pullistercoris]|uniref:BMC domain-containing protein n=1 Tax=Candidatus Eisenbergiella pullistercoris TaxID=2838555 RepID=A0A9D1YQU6_9FIRM|nr:BMC domain-containing protein [Candidatus Eisenbergiella pullistercoris]
MRKSYGLIEISGVVAALDALDIMCKAADVTLATWERKLGGRLVTIIVEGDVAAVTAAVEAAKARAIKPLVSSGVIANPHEETVAQVKRSMKRFRSAEEIEKMEAADA